MVEVLTSRIANLRPATPAWATEQVVGQPRLVMFVQLWSTGLLWYDSTSHLPSRRWRTQVA